MRILMTGGTGFIGQVLCPRLSQARHEVVILSRQSNPRLPRGALRAVTSLDGLDASDFDGVINLAGAPIADARWTASRKRLLLDSRVGTTARLVEWIAGARGTPPALVSASAVGYYGEQGDQPVVEGTPPGPGFAHELCVAWEREAMKAKSHGARVCLVRVGVVLDKGGGALARILPPFRLGLGGRLGSGKHYFPWIHREDVAAAFQWLLENPSASGPYNASAPNPVTNTEFTLALGNALGRPAVLPMPAAAMRLMFGEVADELLLMSQRVLPRRLLDEGFEFQYPRLEQALAAICGQGS
jgi:uncharacterized protein (TIGR01777 family)